MGVFDNKRVVVTGGTGSLGKVMTQTLLSGKLGTPAKVVVFSRDEAKQHYMRVAYQQRTVATDEIIYHNFEQLLEFRIGDVRDYGSVCGVLKDADIVIHAAALKQVPSCEYFPDEAMRTNIMGANNVVRAIRDQRLPVEVVVGVSTDKACKPVNVMGMTKAIAERIFVSANLVVPTTRFVCVRYGNVLASRGSVIPLFLEQIRNGGPVTVTTEAMTRFLLPLDRAVETIVEAVKTAHPGETLVPRVPACRILDVARALIGDRQIRIEITGIRPGEKVHEELVSDEEAWHTVERGSYYAIRPMLPELAPREPGAAVLGKAYQSSDSVLSPAKTVDLLERCNLMSGTVPPDGELLR